MRHGALVAPARLESRETAGLVVVEARAAAQVGPAAAARGVLGQGQGDQAVGGLVAAAVVVGEIGTASVTVDELEAAIEVGFPVGNAP